MHTILIRFNTEHQESPLKWRVIINGVERLASRVVCHEVALETTEDTLPDGRIKHHVTVKTTLPPEWVGDELYVKT